MPPFDELTRAFVTLFVIIDPIGTVPIYLTIAGGLAMKQQRVVILWALFFMGLLLTATTFFGVTLLDRLNISKQAFGIAGGIFLFWTSFEMLFEKRQARREKSVHQPLKSQVELRALAITPLTIPLLAGPGTLTATMVLASETQNITEKLYLLIVIAAVMMFTAFILFMGSLFSKYIDETFRVFISRVMGLILGALAVQMIVNAVTSFT